MKKGDLIAVYGSLRPGETAMHYMQGRAEHLGTSRVSGTLHKVGWYPGMKRITDDGEFISEGPTVVVDVYAVKDPRLGELLDGYEGYPHLFGRHKLKTEEGHEAWVYEYNGDVSNKELVPSGDWSKR